MRGRIASRVYQAKDYNLARQEHERTPSTIRRYLHPTMGPCYEVIYIPLMTYEDSEDEWQFREENRR